LIAQGIGIAINLFGGRGTPYESLIDRGRREALLRMKSAAMQSDARYIFNVKYETSRLSGTAAIEVLAYGTALSPRKAVVGIS